MDFSPEVFRLLNVFLQLKADGSPQQRERSSSPQDMDISESESEDGQITKQEQEEERLLSLGGYKKAKSIKEEATETPCTMADLESCRLMRDKIAKHCIKPWFEDYVKGIMSSLIEVFILS